MHLPDHHDTNVLDAPAGPELDAGATTRHPRGDRRFRPLWFLVLPALCLGLLGTAIGTGGVAHAEEARAPVAGPDGSKLNGRLNVSGVDLELTSVRVGADTSERKALPTRVTASGTGESAWVTADWSYVSTWAKAAELEATYRVVGTPYEIWVRMEVPPLLPNSIQAKVRLASTHEQICDPWLDVNVAFRDLGYDPHPVISVRSFGQAFS